MSTVWWTDPLSSQAPNPGTRAVDTDREKIADANGFEGQKIGSRGAEAGVSMSDAVLGDRRGGWLDDEGGSACKELALRGLRGTV